MVLLIDLVIIYILSGLMIHTKQTNIPERSRIIVGDAIFEPATSDWELWIQMIQKALFTIEPAPLLPEFRKKETNNQLFHE